MNDVPEQNTLGGGLAVLRRRWLIIVIIAAICVGLAAYHQSSRTKQYKATANVTFDNSSLSQAALAVQTGTTDPTRDGPTNVLVATSLQVAAAVKKQLNTSVPAQDLVSDVSAQVAPNANVLQITATSADPPFAAELANAFADQYVNYQTASQIAAINRAQTDLQRQLAALPAGSADAATIQQSIQRLTQLRAVADGGSQIISQATTPGSPSGSPTSVVIVIGLLIGLAIAFTVVFLLESFDRRISSTDEFQREYRLPLLATIPEGFNGGSAASRAERLEPFRILRTAIDLSSKRPVKTLLVTSAVTGEGKTTVAIDLAHAAALTGRQVTLVEFDLRRPTFSKHFPLEPRRGFTTLAADEESLEDLLVRPLESLPNLRVLPSGALPPNPAELLQSSMTRETLTSLLDEDALVIIDSPPLNPVADAQVLLSSPVVDAAIVVARYGFSKRDEVRRARSILDRELVQPLGIVVTGTIDVERYGSGYGYGPEKPARRFSMARGAKRRDRAALAPKASEGAARPVGARAAGGPDATDRPRNAGDGGRSEPVYARPSPSASRDRSD